MTRIYLFDWGDTLMVDFPQYQGKMCHWPEVQAVPGALEALRRLSANTPIYIATNADDSSTEDIKLAFQRAGLAKFISGYFCKTNMGIAKGNPEYFHRIVLELDVEPHDITMVGDSLENDIQPAIAAGLNAIWYCSKDQQCNDRQYEQIRVLEELN
ncbi:HAD family hydrolase [Photobacterium sp. DNB23_23_1]|uniref:HAD family hydrolase n=1 Tax=Photobacterium pectinilyticum TaxID=2906793 RepID=A0ABT1NAU3_9GAMM|nr:HAD family hydrolase [Photobacterium sp. ZSDE20]MCQ1060959.1 HAD family hydrolase [Photobacterium sp. ZSDE20]MDD1828895.1 HAD family hydrolase [Photobacterium sp. ZSDE20]